MLHGLYLSLLNPHQIPHRNPLLKNGRHTPSSPLNNRLTTTQDIVTCILTQLWLMRPLTHVAGPYLLLQTLGEGEFGKVKLGSHNQWGEEVAVKLIKRGNIDADVQSRA
jgi:serine/threonine protein kinase